MAPPADHLDVVGEVVEQLRDLGLAPVLVGGMALVVLGSRRVTRDFDFVVALPGERLRPLVAALYDHDLELVARVDEAGNVTGTIANRRVAAIRLRMDGPSNAYFFNRETGLRIDLLFDFPVTATALAEKAKRVTIRSHAFDIASEEDLLRLKRIAKAARSVPGDADDIRFLESRRRAKGDRS